MKKSILTLAVAFGISGAFAQETTPTLVSKKGEPFLPEAGDWGIVVDASPFLNYVGDFFSTSGGTSPINQWADDFTITGKYFTDAKTAYRAKVRLGFNSDKSTVLTPDVTSTATPTPNVEDEEKVSDKNVTLGGGMEWRRGKTRLQGFFGGEALINFSGSKTTYEYGNAISSTNTSHTTNFGQSQGTLESKSGSTFGLTIRGFVGAEYFIFPKMSLGLEYGWGLGFERTGHSETTAEFWNGTAVESTTVEGGTKSSSFGIDTDNSGGLITLGFHF